MNDFEFAKPLKTLEGTNLKKYVKHSAKREPLHVHP